MITALDFFIFSKPEGFRLLDLSSIGMRTYTIKAQLMSEVLLRKSDELPEAVGTTLKP